MHDFELDRFKREVHLVQYAIERYGYVRDKRESSVHSHVLRRASDDDKLVVRRDGDGHWTYFSVRDGRDSGTVVDFVQRRGPRSLGEVRQELRQWLGVPRPELEAGAGWDAARALVRDRRGPVEAFAAARIVESCAYLQARGLRPETLGDERFAGTWRQDRRGRVLFVHRDETAITGFEVKSRDFTGFATGGTKTAWRSAERTDDRALIVAESAIDALSYHQLHRDPNARYMSTGGGPSRRQVELLDRAIEAMPAASRIVAATDADSAGAELARRIGGLAARHAHVRFAYEPPGVGKDWNEALQRVERDYIRSLPLSMRALGPAPRERGR